jgi:hypothetical protein
MNLTLVGVFNTISIEACQWSMMFPINIVESNKNAFKYNPKKLWDESH